MNIGVFCRAAAGVVFGIILSFSAALAEDYSGKVVSVTDGDSITVLHGAEKEKIILYGVDSPEIKQDFGEQARKFTDDSCYGKTVNVSVTGHDSRGRTIARIFLPSGKELNTELVQHGFAWWSDKYAPDDKALKQAHSSARAAKVGLWSAPNPVAPWIFRNGERSVKAVIRPAH